MEQSNNWEKLKIISNASSIVIIPLVIAFLGNLYSKSTKEKEIQGRFVELSLQILKEKPSGENKNIRKWAVNVINEYSGVKLEPEAEKDLIENVPLTVTNRSDLNFDVPISKNEEPIQVQVIFGYAQMGAALINIYNSDNKLITQFKSTPGTLYTLPKLNFDSTSYFNIVIEGSTVDTNLTTSQGSAQIFFYQGKKTIAKQVFKYAFKEEGGINRFVAKGKVFLK